MRLEEYPNIRPKESLKEGMKCEATWTFKLTERLDYCHPYSRMIMISKR